MISINENEHMLEQKYRPQTIEECVLPKKDKDMFNKIIKSGELPHIILHSERPGTGKTTIAKILCEQMNVEYIFVNGADAKIDYIRENFPSFASSSSLNGKRKKAIIIDEFDRRDLVESQKYLRSFLEAYSHNCSVIITGNDLNAFIEPLKDRCRVIGFGTPTKKDEPEMMKNMVKRLFEICANENVVIEDKRAIALLVKNTFPSFRKTMVTLDQYISKYGKIDVGVADEILNNRSDIDEVIEALKNKNFRDLRAISAKNTHDFANFVTTLCNELYPLVNGQSIIRMYEICGSSNQMYGLAASAELHVMYMLTQLTVEMVWK